MKSKKIVISGVSVTYYEQGKGPTLIFFHGGRLRANTFSRLLESLAKHYTVIAPDIPGYGSSSTPKDTWSLRDYAVFFEKFITTLQLDSITVIGYSLGGGIGLYLASISTSISTLILIDSAGVNKETNSFLNELKRISFYVTHPQHIKTFLTLIKESFIFYSKHLFDIYHMQQIRKACRTSIFDAYEAIRVPTYIFWGDADWILSKNQGEILSKQIMHSHFFVVKGNHDWPLYNSSQLATLLLQMYSNDAQKDAF